MKGFSLLSLDVVHSSKEPAWDPWGGGVTQGRGLPEPRRPEVAGVRVVARVEAGQVGAVWGAQAATHTTGTAWGGTSVNIFKADVFDSSEMHLLWRLFILATKVMLSQKGVIMI